VIPYDIVGRSHDKLLADRRPPDGLLHASSNLTGSLRHSMLCAAGAPMLPCSIVDEIVPKTGTMWHELANQALLGLPYMAEVNLTSWMPRAGVAPPTGSSTTASAAPVCSGARRRSRGRDGPGTDREGRCEHGRSSHQGQHLQTATRERVTLSSRKRDCSSAPGSTSGRDRRSP
jgi:hypothetical protein